MKSLNVVNVAVFDGGPNVPSRYTARILTVYVLFSSNPYAIIGDRTTLFSFVAERASIHSELSLLVVNWYLLISAGLTGSSNSILTPVADSASVLNIRGSLARTTIAFGCDGAVCVPSARIPRTLAAYTPFSKLSSIISPERAGGFTGVHVLPLSILYSTFATLPALYVSFALFPATLTDKFGLVASCENSNSASGGSCKSEVI